tara:strand:- start:383 stop:730 length:348 start_codon:yes stop_codon:yes gene_type:complete
MGLKSNIETALLQNLTPTKDENFKFSEEGAKKIDELSMQLTIAIRDFIQAQTFTVTKLDATQLNVPVVTPTGPGTAAKVTVKIDENSQAVDNPLSGAESMTSEVKLKNITPGSDF